MRHEDKYGYKKALALDTWVKLARAFSTFEKRSNESIRSFGLSQAQFGVIECLGHLGDMTVGTLCNKMLVSGGNMTLVLDNLEKSNLIERVKDPKDRRAVNISLTQKGRQLFENIFSKHSEYVCGLMAVLEESEQKELGILLKKLGLGIKPQK